MDALKIFGIISFCVAGLLGYLVATPSETLKADPGNSLILIIFTVTFAGAGAFLFFFSYMYNAEED